MSQTTPTLDSSIPARSDERLDLTHQNVNGYRVLHRLGAGGMADVYLAFHEQLQRHVALKVMRADLSASKDHIQRFLQEARSAASLIHPNIVQV
ncbi:MAG: protein kinase domain-containing protein, partial [Pirellulaceae bacterium]